MSLNSVVRDRRIFVQRTSDTVSDIQANDRKSVLLYTFLDSASDIADPAAWAAARRRELAELKALL